MGLSKFARRVLIWGNLIAFGILLIVPGTAAVSWALCKYQVSQQLAALRAQGVPTNGEELNRYLSIPAGEPDATAAWLKAIDAVNALTDSKAAGEVPQGPSARWLSISQKDRDLQTTAESSSYLQQSEAYLQLATPTLQTIRIAAATPGKVRLPRDSRKGQDILLEYNSEIRAAGRLLIFAARMNIQDGDDHAAFENISQLLTLGEVTHREPFLVGQLVRIAVITQARSAIADLLPVAHWEEPQLIQLQNQVGGNDFRHDFQHALITERAFCLMSIRESFWEPFRAFNKRRALGLFAEALGAFDFDWPVTWKRLTDLNADVELERQKKSMWNWGHLALTVMPSVEGAGNAAICATARQRCLIVALAARRGQLQGEDLPENVNAIPDTLFANEKQAQTSRIDPYSGKPLLIRQQDGEWTIYSVGSNLKDDDGAVDEYEAGQPIDVGYAIRWGTSTTESKE